MAPGLSITGRVPRGFTLVELLVVLGILALLISMLLPAMTATRRAAERTVCVSHLRELVRGSHLHLLAERRLPDPLYVPAAAAPMPAAVQPRLLTEIARHLALRDPSAAVSIDQLPDMFVCPVRKKLAYNTALDAGLGAPSFQTGYMYLGALEKRPTAGVLLQPFRHARQRGNTRGALWADTFTVHTYNDAVVGYNYFHATGTPDYDPAARVNRNRFALEGQNVGYSDGSVEWRPGKSIAFDAAHPDAGAAYKISIGPVYKVRYLY